MSYGKRSAWQRPHDAAYSSRAPSVERGARSLAARYDLNPKTVRKWRQRTTTADAPMGVIRPELVVSQKPPAAYWFTASTSFANPAVTIARAHQ